MNTLRRLLFLALIITGGSLATFAQKKDDKPQKGPPIIVVKPKEGEKPKGEKPKDGKKPQGGTFGLLNLVKLEEE